MRHILLLAWLLTGGCVLLTGAFRAECGDGFLQRDESCDDGNLTDNDGCSALCDQEDAVCGNNIIEEGEQCDPPSNSTECGPTCQLVPITNFSVCGDGVLSQSEACDDGNEEDGDGCSRVCLLE